MLNPFDIRKGEGRRTLLMFSYFFLTITVLYVLKPVRSSLFLEELGSKNLRYVYLAEGALLLFLTWAYIHLAKLVPKKIFFISTLLFFISNLVIFWWLFHIKAPYLSAFFYVWVACFSITSVTQFWTLANDIFDPLEAKRLFGLIISGGSAGGVLGGILTSRAVQWIRTEDLLLFSAVLLAGCVFLVARVCRHLPATKATHPSEAPRSQISIRKLFFSSPYFWMIAGMVLLPKVASTVVDNQFNAAVEVHLPGKEEKTAFFGGFSAALNIISFLMQLYATSLSLRFLGLGISLTLLPLGLSAASIITFFYPMLWTATSLKVFDGSMNYSIQQASKEVLYLPISSEVRYRIKPVIDMLIYRVSKSLGGLLIILLASVFAIPNERIGILVLFLVPFWLILVWRTRGAYLTLLRENLWKETGNGDQKPQQATEVLSFLSNEEPFDQIQSLLNQGSSVGRKLAATAWLAYRRSGKDLEAARQLVNYMVRWEALGAASKKEDSQNSASEKEFLDELLLGQAEKESGVGGDQKNHEVVLRHIWNILQDSKTNMALKRKAALYLEHQPDQEAARRLFEILVHTGEHAVRLLLLRTLQHIKDRHPEIRWSRALIKKEVLKEAELCGKLQKLQNFYHKHQMRKEEFLEISLEAIRQESLERIFRCLALIYPGEALRIIYDRLIETNGSDSIRSHAIELLQNLLGPEFYNILEPLLEKGSKHKVSEDEIASIVEEMISSPDRWLSLTAQFLVGELGWESRWPKLTTLISNRSFESLDI